MNRKIISCASKAQTERINEILSLSRENYYLIDIFNILPAKIETTRGVGYLKVSNIDIIYSSIESEMSGGVIAIFQYIVTNKNIFDGFIDALVWMKKHNIRLNYY